MKAVYLGTDDEQFKENYKKALIEFYGDKTEIVAEDNTKFIFKLPFAQEYFSRVLFKDTTVKIGTEDNISGVNIDTEFLFDKSNSDTTSNLLILKENSITLLQTDSRNTYGGHSIYSISNTDKGLVFFSYCQTPDNIEEAKSVHIKSNKDLTPLTFGNQYVSKDNEVLKQPLKLTDTDGVIYTCKDIYNISYKPEDFTALPKSFISDVGGANKTHPDEKFNTSILIYDEED